MATSVPIRQRNQKDISFSLATASARRPFLNVCGLFFFLYQLDSAESLLIFFSYHAGPACFIFY